MARSRRRLGRRLEDLESNRMIQVPTMVAPAAPMVLGEPGGDGGILGGGALGGPVPAVRKGKRGKGRGKGKGKGKGKGFAPSIGRAPRPERAAAPPVLPAKGRSTPPGHGLGGLKGKKGKGRRGR
jgi:hypothetical protein